MTGGEPLVRRGIVDFIRELGALPTSPEITLTTNGLLLAEMAADLPSPACPGQCQSRLAARKPFHLFSRRQGLHKVLAGLH
ncbi:MAG: hypothetical protein R2864_00750 [Syntrophotaleaceae bacterium]